MKRNSRTSHTPQDDVKLNSSSQTITNKKPPPFQSNSKRTEVSDC